MIKFVEITKPHDRREVDPFGDPTEFIGTLYEVVVISEDLIFGRE